MVKPRFVVSDICSASPSDLLSLFLAHVSILRFLSFSSLLSSPLSPSTSPLPPVAFLVNLSFPLLSFHSLGPSPSVPQYRPTSTYTAYSNEPRIVRCISGTNWILKIKKKRPRKAPASRTYRNRRSRFTGPPAPLVLFFLRARSDPSLAARVLFVSVNARFVIVSLVSLASRSRFDEARLVPVSRRHHENREGAAPREAQQAERRRSRIVSRVSFLSVY